MILLRLVALLAVLVTFVSGCTTTFAPASANNELGPEAITNLYLHTAGWSIWPIDQPAVMAHELHACGLDCLPKSDDYESLAEQWIIEGLTRDNINALHRGELLATAAALSFSPDSYVMIAPGITTVDAMLLEEIEDALSLEPVLYQFRERAAGVEYGFLLEAACAYLEPQDPVIEALIERVIEAPNRKIEGGAHEFLGLAFCASQLPQEGGLHDRVTETLEAEKRAILSAMDERGQVYADVATFRHCDAPLCATLADLNRQAHYIEWAGQHGALPPRVIRRFEELLYETSRGLDQAWAEADPTHAGAVIAAVTHAESARRLLAGHRH